MCALRNKLFGVRRFLCLIIVSGLLLSQVGVANAKAINNTSEVKEELREGTEILGKSRAAVTGAKEKSQQRIQINRYYSGTMFKANGKKYKYCGYTKTIQRALSIMVYPYTFQGHPIVNGRYYVPVRVRFTVDVYPNSCIRNFNWAENVMYGYPQLIRVTLWNTNLTTMKHLDIQPKVAVPEHSYSVSGEDQIRWFDSLSLSGSVGKEWSVGGELTLFRREYQTKQRTIARKALEISTRANAGGKAEWIFDYKTSRTDGSFNNYCTCDSDQQGMLSWFIEDSNAGAQSNMSFRVECEYGFAKGGTSTELYFMTVGDRNSLSDGAKKQLEFFATEDIDSEVYILNSTRGTACAQVTLTFDKWK